MVCSPGILLGLGLALAVTASLGASAELSGGRPGYLSHDLGKKATCPRPQYPPLGAATRWLPVSHSPAAPLRSDRASFGDSELACWFSGRLLGRAEGGWRSCILVLLCLFALTLAAGAILCHLGYWSARTYLLCCSVFGVCMWGGAGVVGI